MERWPYVFVIFEQSVKVDVKADCVYSSNHAGWYASRGCGEYSKITVEGGKGGPFIYINYGLAVLNAIHQNCMHAGDVAITVQKWGQDFGGQAAGPPTETYYPLDAGDYDAELNMFKPGVIITYDWVDSLVLSPVLPSNNLAAPIWMSLKHNPSQPMPRAGLMGLSSNAIIGDTIASFDILSSTVGAPYKKTSSHRRRHPDGKIFF